MKYAYAAAVLVLLLAPQARAQGIARPGGANADRIQTVMVTFQLSRMVPALASASELTSGMASTSQSLYEIINHQCEVLTASIKGTCRLMQMNVGGNIGNANNRIPNAAPTFMVTATANATFEIERNDSPTVPDAPKAP